MTFVSYAQNFEDVMLWRALGHLENGFYIDVGAFSPDIASVTRAFYDRGWNGINVEPNPQYLEELESHRDRDVNLGIAIDEECGETTLHVVEDPGLTTLHSDIAKMHAKKGWTARQITVQTKSLNSVWAEHVPPGQPVHFLKVDVEGHERAVIAGLDWAHHRPWIVVVEATVPMSEELSYTDWDDILCEAGYDCVYWDGLNRFYLAAEHADLKGAFSRPPNVFDDFMMADYVQAKSELAQALEDLEREAEVRAVLEQALEAQGGEAEKVRNLVEKIERRNQRSNYLAGQPLWERLLFRETGKPKRPLRRLLFHTNGKPRGMFRHLVLHKNRRPHSPFRKWMHSEHYQSLPGAVRLPGTDEVASKSLSRREAYFMTRLQSACVRKEKEKA